MTLRTAVTALFCAIQARIPVLLWGDPGIGKSSIVAQVAAQLGLHVEIVIASIREPSDFAGIPMINPQTGSVVLASPRWAQRLVDADRPGCLFLDEITQCPPATQGGLMRVVLDREAGDTKLRDDCAIVAAANPATIAAGGFDLAPPLANRFLHLPFPADLAAWADGMVGGWAEYEVPVLPADWRKGVPQARAQIAAFVKAHRTHFKKLPDNAEDAGKAYPTPRTWYMCAEAMAALRAMGLNPLGDVAALLYQGLVGPEPGAQLVTWLTEQDLPDPEEALADPKGFDLPKRGDRLAAFFTSLVSAAVEDRPDKVKRWAAAWTVIVRADRKDAVLEAAATLATRTPDNAPTIPEAVELIKVMRAAGYY